MNEIEKYRKRREARIKKRMDEDDFAAEGYRKNKEGRWERK